MIFSFLFSVLWASVHFDESVALETLVTCVKKGSCPIFTPNFLAVMVLSQNTLGSNQIGSRIWIVVLETLVTCVKKGSCPIFTPNFLAVMVLSQNTMGSNQIGSRIWILIPSLTIAQAFIKIYSIQKWTEKLNVV